MNAGYTLNDPAVALELLREVRAVIGRNYKTANPQHLRAFGVLSIAD